MSSSEDWRQTVLLFLDGRMLPARIPWNNGDELIRQISSTAGIDRQGLIGVHFVRNRPRDFIQHNLQCLLLQTVIDPRPSGFVRLILIDLELFEPNEVLPGTFKRFSKWLPMTLNRVSAFRLLDLEQLLIDHPAACRLWHNQIPIPEGQLTPMHLEDGDYFKILVGGHGGLLCSDSESSSFQVERPSQIEDSESNSLFQRQISEIRHASVDVDPLSKSAVCISDRPIPYLSIPMSASSASHFSMPHEAPASTPVGHVRYDGPGRPPRVERPTWFQEVWDLLCTAGETEMEEEGPVIYMNSFYISHTQHPRMHFARPLRFDAEHDSWEEDIKFMWEDYFDRSSTFELFVVHPDPPVTIYQGTVATVIIVQHPQPHKAACVVTAFPDSHSIRHVSTTALSLDHFIPPLALVREAGVEDLCIQPGCRIFIGSQDLPVDANIRIYHGLGLQVRIPVERLVDDPRSTELIRATPASDMHAPSDRDEDTDDLQLFTQQTRLLHATSPHPFIHADKDGSEASSFAFTIPIHDIEEPHGDDFPHLLQLEELNEAWHQASPIFAVSTEEASVTFAFWYLDGARWPTCDHPRLLTLPHPRRSWEHMIRRLWSDRVHPGSRLLIEPIKPPPNEASSAGHFLLHQNVGDRFAGVLLSVFRHDATSRLHNRIAVIASSRTTLPDLWIFTDIADECRTRRLLCVGFRGSESITTEAPLFLNIGDHIEIHGALWSLVTEAASCRSHDSDVGSLMQHDPTAVQSQATICGVGLSNPPHEGGTFQFQANAPVFVPGMPWGLATYDEFIQDLFVLWDEFAFAWEDQDRSCSVAVWFVDHHWPHPHCTRPRVVRLYPDLDEWRLRIWQAWQDQIIPGHELEFHIVTPRPPTVDGTVAAHIVLIQRPNDFWVTSVVSCFDFSTAPRSLTQFAITTHEHILLDNLARVLGIFENCFGQTRTRQCDAMYGTLPIHPGIPLAGRSGYGIVVRLQPLAPAPVTRSPAAPIQEEDTQSLLSVTTKVHPVFESLSASGPSRNSVVDPLSTEAVSIPLDGSVFSWYVNQFSCQVREPVTNKLSDNQPSGQDGQQAGVYPGLIPVDIPTHAANHVEIPDFVFDILRDLQPNGIRANGEIVGLVIRVWYVHHRWRRLSRIARYLQLAGPPSSWQAQVIALWIDRLVPIEAIAIHVVKPQPFRTQHEQSIAFDVIVSQGLYESRMAGLVSVYPTPSDPSLASYTVAVSCRPRFSGEWLIHALALGPICQVHRCQIFHGWTEIPTTPIVTHDMHEGDGFAFHIFRQMPIPPQTLDPTDQAPTDVVAHDHAVDESQGPVLLQLNTLIRPAELSSPASDNFSTVSQRPVKLEGLGQLRTQLPSYISVDETQIRDAIKDELQAFGHLCDFALAANNTLAVCFPDGWTPEPDQILILFTDMQQNVPSEDSAFLTMTEQVDWTEIQLMALLHRLGVEKGVVLRTKPFNTNFIEMQFVQPTGTIDDLTAKQRIQRPWPPRNQRSYGMTHPCGNQGMMSSFHDAYLIFVSQRPTCTPFSSMTSKACVRSRKICPSRMLLSLPSVN